ncbi:hypothetical protein ASPZODRAFT_127279 [Penicilliopsis zonata CBS 506.65]|uniref:Protein kinase domain-containing protein n=1 Tax=Penicilliopsis zonata CBS 506.65 TaxID=1073090 RepID=A0A1L9SW09_9EURO|nr:hypothetical protein ASPZODRAFT_127279 [Penicilliopsis zonata CBS 506.65]OJJ51243.1 hypothetical protein ASPZODRAFT_127279 [Penicilliopsis zonata CBS 506.65]
MSLFRSAAEISSSSESSSDGENSSVMFASRRKTATGGSQTPTTSTAPRLRQEDFSKEASVNETPVDSREVVDPDAGGHANLMTAALLEFYCLSRAADILNAQPGSHGQFTRDSPEVQYLGKRMYAYKSKFLSSHGLVAGGIETEEFQPTRQYYRDNLDYLGMTALEELNIDMAAEDWKPPVEGIDSLALVFKPSANRQVAASKDYAEAGGPTQPKGRMWNFKRLPSTENVRTVQDAQINMGNLLSPALPLFASSPVSVPILGTHPVHHGNRMSRYAVEFSEMRILGRGSFGEVYHVQNHIDGQSYAVKKIPLSRKRLEQLQRGGENQLETIMKEIRTLARLEHTNIVRYYGAWIEQAHPPNAFSLGQHARYPSTQHDESQEEMTTDDPLDEQSFGIVFEHSESSAPEATASTHSAHASESDVSSLSHKQRRRSSLGTMASSFRSKKSFLSRSLEDEDVESIPREFSIPTHGPLSTIGASDDDIFTDGLSQDRSQLQIQRRSRSVLHTPAVVLHIQMSLHPISLSSYLNPQPERGIRDENRPLRRHCFHLVPSLRLMLNIISGVEYLHSMGIVHRDLKPANIFLSPSERKDCSPCPTCSTEKGEGPQYCHPRIGDFGLVADISHLNDCSPGGGPDASSTLSTGLHIDRVVGTEFYRPPLLVSAADNNVEKKDHCTYTIDEKLDVYALGVILFELLYRLNTKMERQMVLSDLSRAAKNPGNSKEPVQFPLDFTQKIDQGHVRFKDDSSINEALIKCLRGMLDPSPSSRWSCQDVKKTLVDVLGAADSV